MRSLQMLVAIGALAIIAHTAAAQTGFDQAPPFGLGRVLGQVTWGIENCGGQLTPQAVELRARAMAKDPDEFNKGLRTGASDMNGYIAMMGSPQAVCSLVRGIYGRKGAGSGLWLD